ncbi:uncharacterized protein DMENIID0001_081910 [Sergentomyia squamirostris]
MASTVINSYERRKVIVDVDVGSDDAWALLMLLRVQQLNQIEILGITCVKGNTDVSNVAQNILRLYAALEDLGTPKPPIYLGSCCELINMEKKYSLDNFHGTDGFGDLDNYPGVIDNHKKLVAEEHAVNAIERLVKKNPGEVSIVCLGPLTNMALTLRMYPHVALNIKEIYIMGGNSLGVGNITSSAEFNFYADPEAAHIVLGTVKRPMFLMPWESCLEDRIKLTMDWRLNVLGAKTSQIVKFLNAMEKKLYVDFTEWVPCDAFLTAAFLTRNTIVEKISEWNATVELAGFNTRGQLILDHLHKKPKNLKIIEKINQETFQDMVLWTAGHDFIDVHKFLP